MAKHGPTEDERDHRIEIEVEPQQLGDGLGAAGPHPDGSDEVEDASPA